MARTLAERRSAPDGSAKPRDPRGRSPMKTLVIAEAGSCHDRNLQKAFALIDAAADAGADVCKFQWWSNPEKLADRRRVPDGYRQIYRRYAFPAFWLGMMKSRCVDRGIEFMCTAYLPEDVAI